MNILFLTHNDIQKDIGGIESHITLLSSELLKIGHQPYILTSQNKDGSNHSLFKGIPLLHVNKPHNTERLIWEEEMEKRVTEVIVEYKIDLIHAHSSAANNLIKKRIKTPLIITFHCAFSDGFYYDYYRLKNTHSIKEKANQFWTLVKSLHTHLVKDEEPYLFYKNIKYMIAVSPRHKKSLQKTLGIKSNQLQVISPGINTNIFSPLNFVSNITRTRFGIDQNAIMILCTGRFARSKGFHLAIEALGQLHKVDKNIVLVICGTGRHEENLRMLSIEMGLSKNVLILPPIQHEQLPGLINLSDIVVVPSIRSEAFGLTTAEAMSCEKPVVAFDHGASPYVIGDKAGVLVKKIGPVHLAKALKSLIESPELRTELGKNGRKRVLRLFDSKIVANDVIKVYNKAILDAKDKNPIMDIA